MTEATNDQRPLHEWRHVPVGACVRLKSGTWHVTGKDGHVVCMRNVASGREVTGSPPRAGQVVVLQPGDPGYVPPPEDVAAVRVQDGLSEPARELLAQTLVTVRLGAHVVATRDLGAPESPSTCPAPETMMPILLATHLYLFHRLEVDDPVTLADPPPGSVLLALHDSRRVSAAHRHDQYDHQGV